MQPFLALLRDDPGCLGLLSLRRWKVFFCPWELGFEDGLHSVFRDEDDRSVLPPADLSAGEHVQKHEVPRLHFMGIGAGPENVSLLGYLLNSGGYDQTAG